MTRMRILRQIMRTLTKRSIMWNQMCIRDRRRLLKQVTSKEKALVREISYVLTFSGGAVFGIAFLCLLQAGKGYPKKEE